MLQYLDITRSHASDGPAARGGRVAWSVGRTGPHRAQTRSRRDCLRYPGPTLVDPAETPAQITPLGSPMRSTTP